MMARALIALPSLLLAACTVVSQPAPSAPGAAPRAAAPARPAPASPRSAAATPQPTSPAPAATPAPRPTTAAPAPTPTAPAPAPPTTSRPAAPTAATTKAPEPPPAITSVDVDVYNNCNSSTDYCVDDGNQLYTFASSNSHNHHTVRPGARIRYRKSTTCTDVVYVVTSDSATQKANLCK